METTTKQLKQQTIYTKHTYIYETTHKYKHNIKKQQLKTRKENH